MLIQCSNCPCQYSAGAVACPQCGSVEIQQQNVPDRPSPKVEKPVDVEPKPTKAKAKGNAGTSTQK